MSIQTKAILKSYFETGDTPTQDQFAELIESMAPAMEDNAGIGLKAKKDSEGYVNNYELDIAAVVINASAITGQTYASPTAAAEALIAINGSYSEIAEGMSIKYKDPLNRIWEYRYVNSNWVLTGDRSVVRINEELNDAYIYFSGQLYVSQVISGSGTQDDPYIYKYGTTPFVEITELEGIYYKGRLNYGMIGICAYDANMVVLSSGYDIIKATADDQVIERYLLPSDIPTGTKYVRFCSEKAYDYEFRIETDSAVQNNSMQIIELRKDVRNLKLMQTGGVAGFWDSKSLDPQMESFIGNKEILDDWDFYLVKEDGHNTEVIGKLQKNNLFRFEDGSYAPVMVRTADDAFENPGWETVDHGYGIVRAWNHPMYIIDGVGLSGRIVHGLFKEPVTIDGITAKMIEQTGICADSPTLYNDYLRCIMFKAGIDTGCGSRGVEDMVDVFKNGAYPYGVHNQKSNCELCRKKNTSAPLSTGIFSEQMGIHTLSHIYAHFLKYGTYDLHNYRMFGGGISSNEPVNESNWGTVSGVKWFDDIHGWNYARFNQPFLYQTSFTNPNWSMILNRYSAKLQTLEAQAALSYVVENNIHEDQEFEFNGGIYYYKTINGTKSPLEGEMNAKLFKKVTFTMDVPDGEGDLLTIAVQVILQVAVVDGYISWGDVDRFRWGGMESVNTIDPSSRMIYANYLCTFQQNLYRDYDVSSEDKFAFQSTYEHTGDDDIERSSYYAAQNVPYSLLGKKSGGSLHTGSCARIEKDRFYGHENKRYAVRSGGRADDTLCSSRRLNISNAFTLNEIYDTSCAYQIRLTGRLNNSN